MIRGTRVACAVLLLLLGTSCGSEDETRPRYSSGISASADVSSLDDGDRRRICQSLDAYVQANVSFESIAYIACLPPAIVLGGTVEGCEEQLDECMALFPEPIELEAELQDQQLCFSGLGECRASVAQLEGCINLNLDFAFQILDGWSCSGAVDRDLRAQAARAMDTAAVCADIDAACNRFAALGPD